LGIADNATPLPSEEILAAAANVMELWQVRLTGSPD
jgi:hypothetical protein